ncbi:MAG: OmpH family outer membrane protein [Cyanobacteria bacterium NC_groundwater_1444_Ag_S-0.65um_54_12]|nr:OmpH family outer membrane protein [Cyanobacteria bacterium NC_groundwater_1444_Ag_S-0.65um_54_12]
MSCRLLSSSCLVAMLLTSVFATPAGAAGASFGFVDTSRIFAQYKAAQYSQAEFRAKAEAYQRELLEKNQVLQRAQQDGKPKGELEKLTKQFENELKPKKAAVEALDKKLSAQLRKKIEVAIAAVAAARQIPVVVDKQVVLYGGADLTDEVLQKLNK